jgi:arabinofuranosyltransferase
MMRKLSSSRTEALLLLGLMALGAAGLYAGWQLFWFLTDDAYIAFRYVSNSLQGYGYVWNPPPFAPVEGYTSFLWLVLLDVVWRLTGLEPPQSANPMALVFTLGTMLLATLMIVRIPWKASLRRWRLAFVALLLVYLVFNRTFLAWASSGLETALFNFLLVLWVFLTLVVRRPAWRAGLGALVAAALALSRPDGWLFCVSSLAITLWLAWRAPDRGERGKVLLAGLLPLGLVVAHLLWRMSFYGECLPNTYCAKVVGIWPESGARYLLSFVLEYGVWFAVAVVVWALLARVGRRAAREAGETRGTGMLETVKAYGLPALVVATVLLHLGYYTFVVGGDHFEYRVYSYAVPLLFVALAWALNRLDLKPALALGLALGFVLLSMPVPWTHWALTKDLNTRAETHVLYVPVAPAWPKPLRWYAELFDRSQSWLIEHHVCMRHQEHKVFWQHQIAYFPNRVEGCCISGEGYPVLATPMVGVPGWVLPHVCVLDTLGLNDYVVARTPVDMTCPRLMAHSCRPPEGYVTSFRPNVVDPGGGEVMVVPREVPLTAEEIQEIEGQWWEAVMGQRRGGAGDN